MVFDDALVNVMFDSHVLKSTLLKIVSLFYAMLSVIW